MGGVSRYLHILRVRDARIPFIASVVGRLPISMTPLAAVLLVQQVRGSYAIAGGVTAAYALGATLGTPVLGRLVDRLGQPRVIAPSGLVSASLLVALALTAAAGAPNAVLVLLAAGAGLAAPPIVAVMRGAWRVALQAEEDRLAAYALDAVAVEFIFVVGPLIIGLLLVTTPLPLPLLVTACPPAGGPPPPPVPLLVPAGLLAGGSLAYARSPAVRAWRPEPHPDGDGAVAPSPLRSRGVLTILAAALLVAAGFGQVDVSIAATAREALGDPGRVGLLFACIAGGSTAGGLWYGSRHWAGPERRRLPVALAGVALGLAPVALLLGGPAGDVRRPPFAALAVLLVVA